MPAYRKYLRKVHDSGARSKARALTGSANFLWVKKLNVETVIARRSSRTPVS